jgi:hypothetical protein
MAKKPHSRHHAATFVAASPTAAACEIMVGSECVIPVGYALAIVNPLLEDPTGFEYDGGDTLTTSRSCTTSSASCSFPCVKGDYLYAAATGLPGGGVTAACGGAAGGCIISTLLTYCNSKSPTAAASNGVGTCSKAGVTAATATISCAAGS